MLLTHFTLRFLPSDDEPSVPRKEITEQSSKTTNYPSKKKPVNSIPSEKCTIHQPIGSESNDDVSPYDLIREKSAAKFYQEAISHVRRSASSLPHLPVGDINLHLFSFSKCSYKFYAVNDYVYFWKIV